MFEFLQYEFIQRGILAGVMVSIATGLIGLFLVQKRLSLLGDGLAHTAFGGIALGFLFNINPLLSGIVFSILGSLGIQRIIEKTKTYGDSAIAIMLSGGMAIALVVIGYTKGFNANLFSYLIGSILSINETDIYILTGVLVAVATFVIFFRKQLMFIILSEDLARLNGVNVSLLNSALIILSAITTVAAIRAVGILLVTGLIVLPALIALQVAKSFREAMIYSVGASILSMIVGIMLAFVFDLPPSAVIVLTMLAIFICVYAFRYFSSFIFPNKTEV